MKYIFIQYQLLDSIYEMIKTQSAVLDTNLACRKRQSGNVSFRNAWNMTKKKHRYASVSIYCAEEGADKSIVRRK